MTTEAAPAPSNEPLSIDAAVGLLADPVDTVDREEEQPLEPELAAEPTAEDDFDPELVIEDDPADEPDPEIPAIAAPQSWDAAERAVFATLSPEAQQVIAARDAEANKAVSRAQTTASEAAKRAEAEVQSVTQLRAATEQVLNRVAETIKGKWDNVDWQAWAQSDPAAYVAGKAQFDAENLHLAQLQAAHQAQQAVELRAFQAQKMERIKTEAPALVDPDKGPTRVAALEKYLESNGISRDIFHTLDAFTIGLAYKGYLYDQAMKKRGTPPPAPTRATPRPGAAAPVRSQQRATAEVQHRFSQTGSVDDAVALLMTRQSKNARSS